MKHILEEMDILAMVYDYLVKKQLISVDETGKLALKMTVNQDTGAYIVAEVKRNTR